MTREEFGRCLPAARMVSGMEMARAWYQALVENVGTCRPDIVAAVRVQRIGQNERENSKRQKP